MNKAIVICSYRARDIYWLEDNFHAYWKYPLYVVVNDAPNASVEVLEWLARRVRLITLQENYWELGAINAMLSTDVDEFFLLQDTIEIFDNSFLDMAFERWPGQSVAFDRNFSHYMGKFRREILLDMAPLPVVTSKEEAIEQEFKFVQAYRDAEKSFIPVIDGGFSDTNPNNFRQKKFGRDNLVLISPYLNKYKGTIGEWVGTP